MRRPLVAVVTFALALGGLSVAALAQEGEPRSVDLACPPAVIQDAGFADVPDGAAHEREIDCVVWWEVARGTTSATYGPASPVTREQMASFITNLVTASDGSLPADPADRFSDDEKSVHEGNINRLAEAGLVAGKGEGRYDPGAPVTREQMATFLVNAYEYRTENTLTSSSDYFDDDDGSAHEDNINKAAEAGFTGGSGGGKYSPAASVTRAQMASFLARVLDLLVEEGHATPPVVPTPSPSPTTDSEDCDLVLDPLCEELDAPDLPLDSPTPSPSPTTDSEDCDLVLDPLCEELDAPDLLDLPS
ncbi:MAG: S-layer homology domain-containing protein [Nitriliruptorales bacterium]